MSTQRTELTTTPYTILGHGTWVALQEHVGGEVSEEMRNAKPKRSTHAFGECSKGPWRCKVHRREAERKAQERKNQQRQAEVERVNRVKAMNVFRIDSVAAASRVGK